MPSRTELANAIRVLSMDAIQKANSGHPGAPMGMADIAEVLWNDFLQHNPANPEWFNRDRFVLSNGHGSMLLYSLLHLSGYELGIEDIKQFRQFQSKTPGHPEYGYTPGVETTTGPLGQGLANAVGMAIAEQVLADQFNREGFDIINHCTYVFMGDGCLMEGISHEVCSLAGTLMLGKLIGFYDDNGISIDGEVDGWFTDDTPARFEAYGWHVVRNVDGHDPQAVQTALHEARSITDKPSLICCKTIIGCGAPNKQGSSACHGAALGDAEIALTRENLNWTEEAPFVIPEAIASAWNAREKGQQLEAAWNKKLADYSAAHPELAAELQRRSNNELPEDWSTRVDAIISSIDAKAESIASRKASQNTIEAFGPLLPELLGGSADLAESNLTLWSGSVDINDGTPQGNYIYYGVREFGMCAMMNGLSLHGGFIPYGATFLVFSDYARNAVRMAALMGIRSIFVFTHDSIGLGEDGPTHQPVEHAASLRLIPNMHVWRPCDAVESAVAWRSAIERSDGPSSLLFSRQGLPHQQRTAQQIADISRGAYVLSDCDGEADLILIASGSEVGLVMQAKQQLSAAGHLVRVVSMPSSNLFDAQDQAYRDAVLPPSVGRRVAVEAGCSALWYKYVGLQGRILGVDSFGESAPAGAVFEHFGLTVEKLVKTAAEI